MKIKVQSTNKLSPHKTTQSLGSRLTRKVQPKIKGNSSKLKEAPVTPPLSMKDTKEVLEVAENKKNNQREHTQPGEKLHTPK